LDLRVIDSDKKSNPTLKSLKSVAQIPRQENQQEAEVSSKNSKLPHVGLNLNLLTVAY
jgi:hypothetical protein